MCRYSSARLVIRLTAAVRPEVSVACAVEAHRIPKQGATGFAAKSLGALLLALRICGSRIARFCRDLDEGRDKLDCSTLYADGKAPSELAAKLRAPCFGFVDASSRDKTPYRVVAPCAIHLPSIARSSSVMFVLLPGGIVRVATARS